MIAGVADTHTALWYSLKNPRLSPAAQSFVEDAARAGHSIVLSSISLAEIVYLTEKDRLPPLAYEKLKSALADPDYVIEETPLTLEVVEPMRQVSRDSIPHMPDRIIAATAVLFRVPEFSHVPPKLQTIW